MTRAGVALALVLGLHLFAFDAPAAAFYEPDGFRGIRWGTSLAEAEQTLKALYTRRVLVGDAPACDAASGGSAPADSAVCVASADIDAVRVTLYFEFHEDRFVAVTVVSTPASYAALKRGFVARYGAPTRSDKRTKMGPFSEYTSEELLWDGPTVQIKLSQLVGGPTFTVAVIALRSELARQEAEQKKSPGPTPEPPK
jgi:hypothetical protein